MKKPGTRRNTAPKRGRKRSETAGHMANPHCFSSIKFTILMLLINSAGFGLISTIQLHLLYSACCSLFSTLTDVKLLMI